MPKISIIIPVYNKVKYLDKLFEDIKNQTFCDFECLVIDDGSTDGSAEKCDCFAQKDNRIRVFHIENNGVSHARNVGLNNVKGKYITFIDSDDRIHIEYLKNLYECIYNNSVDIVISGAEKIWEKKENEKITMPYKGVVKLDALISEFVQIQSTNGLYGYCWAKIFEAELVKNIRFNENLTLAEDVDFYLSLYEKINTIFFDDKAYYYYLQEADNSSVLVSDDDIDYYAQLLIQIKTMRFLTTKDSYSNSNKLLLDTRIWDYIYLVFYHCKEKDIDCYYQQIKSLTLPSKVHFGKYWKDKFLTDFDKNKLKKMKFHLSIYKFLRKLKRSVRRA